MAGERILVVDDQPLNLRLVSMLLGVEGNDVITTSTAEETLAAVEAEPPRLILMDLQLPGMDGLELTRRLKANPTTHDIVVVALTSYAMKGDEERALTAGCDGYIAKPIDTRTLPSLVAAHLARA